MSVRQDSVDKAMEARFGKPQWDKPFYNKHGQLFVPLGDKYKIYRETDVNELQNHIERGK